MIFPTLEKFTKLASQGNFVPVYQELAADLDTPVSAWHKVCVDAPYSFLLESVEGGETLGRYSLLGCDPLWVLETRGSVTTQTFRDGTVKTYSGDPFAVLPECLAPYQPIKLPELPPGIGGLFGFWGYELIQWIEPTVPIYDRTDTDLPDGLWMQVDSLLIFDQVKRKIWVIAYADLRQPRRNLQAAYGEACDRVQVLVQKLTAPLTGLQPLTNWQPPGTDQPRSGLDYKSNRTQAEFCTAVRKAKDYIQAGDIFQVVVSQRLTTHYDGNPFDLYRSLRLVNPSPYMAYFHFKDWQLIGSSPEVMVKADNAPDTEISKIATVRPIAGTRPRGKTVSEDAAFAEDLLADPKEIAEHVMLVDLGRNDLGRVCESGSVSVDELMVIERYSHVMHIVSNVIGQLSSHKTAWDLLKACFPAGTVSGAPKIRAMQIIHELEPDRRGPYSGVYGYYDFEGQLNTAITIRTMITRPAAEGGYAVSVQAGAGLVADSVPESEFQETLNKSQGMLTAIRSLQGK
ncbi:anthranilate synthase component I family protein [Oscillatoria sp. CS-180]|uniref:anthranilate synthase component I family protein n=1 Tax=Oscillatoria sp. CS-180 TaxID=3021720 RepID=UPI0023302308|nr:anthranilate synthase component I family protein [Oscillatoria sp. CS-180]MDB9524618.1 anthranilate synthase component I family protein [Oscillatoria sp. CS-180]